MQSSITFVSGAEEVTGSNFLFESGTTKLLVDCGTREGVDGSKQEPFPYHPGDIAHVLVTHAHQDHIGRIPELVHAGFHGAIHSTAATKDLAAIMFDDGYGILEREAAYKKEPMPYGREDIDRALALWKTHDYHALFMLDELTVEMLDAGHILGSAMMKISRRSGEGAGRSVLFTGDIGNTPEPLLSATESPAGVQYLVMESVYGDRVHEDRAARKTHLREMLEETRAKNGTLLIPSFSLERTQVLLSEMNDLVEREGLQKLPIYLDSPLAARATEVFRKYPDLFNAAAREKVARGDDVFAFPGLTIVDTTRASTALDASPNPKVIIAGAGMSNGGRVRAHEKALLGEKSTTVLFVGYQAPGSIGRRLQDGAPTLHIDGEWVRVHASIATLSGYSGHADRDQLLAFLEQTLPTLERAFIVMGEPKASLFLAQRAHDFLRAPAYVPYRGERVEINI